MTVKTIVLGAGIIGVSTAYYLLQAGHDVTVIDRQPGPGLETSFANGGQVSASHAMPWSNPATPWKLLSWLGRRDAPLVFRLTADPELWRFLFRFLANCRSGPSRANAAAALDLALYNRDLLAATRADVDIQFDALDKGILHVYRSRRELRKAIRTAGFLREFGVELEDLRQAACVELEPALNQVHEALAGGIFSPDDMSGDARAFTHGLAQHCVDHGVKFELENPITRLTTSGNKVTGIMTQRGVITGDRYVLALGSYSPLLLAPLGIRIPVYPAKGYSATVPIIDAGGAPIVSITDDHHKVVISRLGDHLRIAGTAEFNGYNTEINPVRARAVLNAGASLFPGTLDIEHAEFWAGLRPLTPDGVPIIGHTTYPNLILNTGHGTLGWTLACASGRIAADLVSGSEPEIDTTRFSPERF
jgi:D-amino-acid dehydrogenase